MEEAKLNAVSETETFEIKKASLRDLKTALEMGIKDYINAPLYGLFFGSVFAIGGLVLFYSIFELGMLWLAYPLVIGFSLIGPFVATGLYEVSRRLEKQDKLGWGEILTVIWSQHRREFGWMAFVTLFIFWFWMYQIRTLVAVFFGFSGFADFSGFVETLLTTSNGWTFLAVGHLIGAIISLALFVLTVIACPLLLDKEVDIVTAMLTSIRSVLASPVILLLWGGFVVVSILVSAMPAFLGLLIVLPILGHATWHLYRQLIVWN